jgi:hypothetical protein
VTEAARLQRQARQARPARPAKPTPSATLDLDRRGQLEAPPVAGRDAELGVLVGGDRRF